MHKAHGSRLKAQLSRLGLSLVPWALGLVTFLAWPTLSSGQRGGLTATKVPTTIATGTLKDTTVYTLVNPDQWNGTVFFALDSTDLNSDASNWLYAHGIARAGNTRDQIGSLVNHAADNLVETLDAF